MSFYKKYKQHKFVNGTKGAISLLLALLMLPFFSITAILTEINRYHSVRLLLDNSMNNAAVSVLADYDDAIYKRYGLMSISPKANVSKDFKAYLKNNIEGVSGSNMELSDDTSVNGSYPLSDLKVIKRQIAEYNKFNAPLTIAEDFFDISELLKKIDKFSNKFNTLTNAGKTVDSLTGLYETLKKLDEIAKEIEGCKYDEAFDKFRESAENLRDEIKNIKTEEELNAKSNAPEDKEAKKARRQRKNTRLYLLRFRVEEAKEQYAKKCEQLADLVLKLKNKTIAFLEKSKSYQQNIAATAKGITKQSIDKNKKKKTDEIEHIDRELEKTNDRLKQSELTNRKQEINDELSSDNDKLQDIKTCEHAMNKALDSCCRDLKAWEENRAKYIIDGLQDQANDARNYNVSWIDEYGGIPNPGYYKYIRKNLIPTSQIHQNLESIESEANVGSSVISGIASFFNSLFKTQIFFNRELANNIDLSFYEEIGGLPSGNSREKDSFSEMIKSLVSIIKKSIDVITPDLNILKKLKDIKDLIVSFCDFIKNLCGVIKQIVVNIASIFKGNYNRIFTMTYFTSVLSNRLNYDLSDPVPVSTGAASAPFIGEAMAAVNAIKSAYNGGSDKKFNGAELEYIFFGSSSEIANQIAVFFTIYFTRLLLDLIPVSSNEEVHIMTAIPFIGPIATTLVVFAEPFVDTILLVNGSSLGVFKSKIFLTPSGIPTLIDEFVKTTASRENLKKRAINIANKKINNSIPGLSDEEKDKLKNSLQSLDNKMKKDKEASKEKKSFVDRAKDKFKFDYAQHIFLSMVLLGNEDAYLSRLSDLVQMYGQVYWENHGLSGRYNIYKAFTHIESESKAKMKTFFPLPTDISSGSLESFIRREQVRGY